MHHHEVSTKTRNCYRLCCEASIVKPFQLTMTDPPGPTGAAAVDPSFSLSQTIQPKRNRSLVGRLFGRKKNQAAVAEGLETTQKNARNKGRAVKNRKTNKKVQQEAVVGEDREPEAAKTTTTTTTPKPVVEEKAPTTEKAVEKKVEEKKEPDEEPSTPPSPAASAADTPVTPKVVPETVDSDSAATEEENTTTESAGKGTPPADKEEAEKVDSPTSEESVKEEAPKDAPADIDQADAAAESTVQSGDDSARDQPLSKSTGLFCGCI